MTYRHLILALVAATAVLPVAAQQDVRAALADLQSREAEARRGALSALRAAEPDRAVLEAVAFTLGDAEPDVRRLATTVLLELRPDLAALTTTLADLQQPEGSRVVQRAGLRVRLLGGGLAVGGGVDPGRVRDLTSDDPRARIRAVEHICGRGANGGAHEAAVLALLDDDNADVRAAVARCIPELAWNAVVERAVLAALKDPAGVVRRAAAEGLRPQAADERIVAALRGAIQDPDPDVRRHVVQSLAASRNETAAADIVASLRDREAKVRIAALEAVRIPTLRTERTPREVARCLTESDRKVLLAALQTAAALGPAAEAMVPRILELTEHPRFDVSRGALEALWSTAASTRPGLAPLRSVERMLHDEEAVQKHARSQLETFLQGRG